MEDSNVVESPVRGNARGMAGWIRFLGIVNIVAGALNALSLIGILWAWLPIWLGIVLVQAGSRAGDYADKGDEPSLAEFTGRLKTYFIINGIAVIVSLGLAVLAIIGSIAMMAAGVFSLGSLMDYLNSVR